MFPGSVFFFRKNTESTFLTKKCEFLTKNGDVNNFWIVFEYSFLDLETSYKKEHLCQVLGQMGNTPVHHNFIDREIFHAQ